MKKLLLIGIGAGHPEHITVQAVNALNRVQVIFLLDKGDAKDDLVRLRKEICERYIREPGYRLVQVADPLRDASTPSYRGGVEDWHEARARLFAQLIRDEVADGQCAALLIWGDPGLYDSTMRILQRVEDNGSEPFEYEVIPGITSVQSLAAAHRVPLNRIGEPIRITTGRRLAADDLDNVFVMLDAHCSFQPFIGQNLHIYWGAYLGTADEVLIAGPLDEVARQIIETRETARQRKGWIMDTYLLRRPE